MSCPPFLVYPYSYLTIHQADTNGLSASHPNTLPPPPLSSRSQSPVSRTGTPNFLHPSNIAPQHMFEQALNGEVYHHHHHQNPHNPHSPNLEPLSYDSLTAQNTALKTRVSEMELINDLFRNRVTELEGSEGAARETEKMLRLELEECKAREEGLKRRLDELEDGPRHKKARFSDLVDESRAGSPINAMAE